MPNTDQYLLPEAEFLPWYLEVDNKSSLCHIVRQPELSLLMQKITEVEPLIHNLDDYLDEMNKWESELDDRESCISVFGKPLVIQSNWSYKSWRLDCKH